MPQDEGVEITDFAPRFFHRDRVFRPAQLVRRIRPLAGHARIRISVRPLGEWAREKPMITRGSNHLRYVLPSGTLRLTTSAPPTYVAEGTWFSLHSPVSLLFGPDETLSGGIDETAREFEEQTSLYWRSWTRRLAVPLEWQEAVIRAAITLKLCQFEETGAIVAAMTTSIPEAAHSGRNWDYRFCWLRDAFFVVRALNSLSEVGTMEDYLRWLYDVLRGAETGHVQPLYGIGLEQALPESIVPHLAGYRGMGPVRVGNQAYEHFQHDVYGNIVLGAAQAFHDHRLFRRADASRLHGPGSDGRAGLAAARSARRRHVGAADARPRAYLFVPDVLGGLRPPGQDRPRPRQPRAGGALAFARRDDPRAHRRAGLEREAAIVRRKLRRNASSTPACCSWAKSASCRPRIRASAARSLALEDALCDGPYMRRYEAADDFGRPESSFNVCSFWRVDALARIGQQDRARELFEALLARRNHVGLLSEDMSTTTGELWGNFPQTYSMVGIINGAVRLSARWEDTV